MSGYKKMVNEIMSLALLALTINVSLIETILSGMPNLKKAVEFAYDFLKSGPGFMGYLVAAAYYVGLEFGYGDMLCQYAGYGYLVIYYLNVAVTFGQNMSWADRMTAIASWFLLENLYNV